MAKIVIAGGSGFLGDFLALKFRSRGDKVIIISRTKGDVLWKDREGIMNALTDAEAVINLAGRSVDCRYNTRNRNEILHSRLQTTRIMGECIHKCKHPPRLWINSSTATIYRHAEDRPMTEESGEIGSGFSVDVAMQWERTFFDFDLSDTRQVALRMAIVVGKNGGAIQPLKRLAQIGLGGPQGKGSQMFSWIHIEDIFEIILFIMNNKELSGTFNCSSPEPVTNKILMKTLRQVLDVGTGLPLPEWILGIGAVLIRTETELILKSRWVFPERLLKSGYRFKYPTLPVALDEILA